MAVICVTFCIRALLLLLLAFSKENEESWKMNDRRVFFVLSFIKCKGLCLMKKTTDYADQTYLSPSFSFIFLFFLLLSRYSIRSLFITFLLENSIAVEILEIPSKCVNPSITIMHLMIKNVISKCSVLLCASKLTEHEPKKKNGAEVAWNGGNEMKNGFFFWKNAVDH